MDHFGNDQELIELCRDEARARALAAGADPRDVDEVELRSCEGFDMVRGGARAGRIVDIMVQIAAGIAVEAFWRPAWYTIPGTSSTSSPRTTRSAGNA